MKNPPRASEMRTFELADIRALQFGAYNYWGVEDGAGDRVDTDLTCINQFYTVILPGVPGWLVKAIGIFHIRVFIWNITNTKDTMFEGDDIETLISADATCRSIHVTTPNIRLPRFIDGDLTRTRYTAEFLLTSFARGTDYIRITSELPTDSQIHIYNTLRHGSGYPGVDETMVLGWKAVTLSGIRLDGLFEDEETPPQEDIPRFRANGFGSYSEANWDIITIAPKTETGQEMVLNRCLCRFFAISGRPARIIVMSAAGVSHKFTDVFRSKSHFEVMPRVPSIQ